ncbi:MAG: rhodanese-like domain-containing protein [Muribaculaceae bacterium]|nr:rhodanese-like domain-containing protein [Muribaculaceae bacterium]
MKKILIIILTLLGINGCMNAKTKSYVNMDVERFAEYLTNNSVQLLDVRTPEEYAEGHIAGSRNINVFDSDFIDEAEKTLDKSKPVAVYCRSGKRSADAARELSDIGFNVVNLEGGILAWEEHHQPISK